VESTEEIEFYDFVEKMRRLIVLYNENGPNEVAAELSKMLSPIAPMVIGAIAPHIRGLATDAITLVDATKEISTNNNNPPYTSLAIIREVIERVQSVYGAHRKLGQPTIYSIITAIAEYCRESPDKVGIGVGLLVEQMLISERKRFEASAAKIKSDREGQSRARRLFNRSENEAAVNQLDFAVRELSNTVDTFNDVSEEDRDFILIELAALEIVFTQPRISIGLIEHFNDAVVSYLIRKFPDTIIGVAAKKVFEAIVNLGVGI
jgi:hypothetical protein